VNHIETAFGVSPGMISAYHHLKTEADKRRVWDMYMRNLADHRMSPYDPVPFDSIRVKFDFDADPARADVDFSAFDPAMSRAIDEYHFTNWRLHIEGVHGALGKFGEDTPQYQAAFSSYMKQLESHFREKGWMNRPYAYWTDEPKPEKYPEVQAGMERIKKYSPGIRTMITTNHPDGTLQGPIDIWCPVSYNYKPDSAKERMAAGAKYWWYVCTGPKAPFCTLFIDHPATDLRVWLWQTWQRNIEGVLIWETTYWRLGGEQNPYEDPMAYCGEPGLKTYGNGDGRFIYPPLAAASPAGADKAPVLDPPVSCIRSEMLREGIEDYEMLWLLRDLLAKKKSSLTPDQEKAYQALLQVPENITTTMTAFTTDPRPIYARRVEIAEAIERLSQ
jgi:hypothetical protein